MLVAASKRGPTLITRGHDAGLEDIAAGTGDFRIAGFRQRRSPLLLVVQGGRDPSVVPAGSLAHESSRAALARSSQTEQAGRRLRLSDRVALPYLRGANSTAAVWCFAARGHAGLHG